VTSDPELVLVTGFPRLGPRKLALHLLETHPHRRVACVVLPKLVPHAAAVVDAMPREQRRRVEILEGDVAAMDLGLAGREFRELASQVTSIHHMAHVSYVGVDRETAEWANVHGAIEIVELARAAERLSVLVHYSTAFVSGDRKGVVYEHELDEGQSFHSVVHETRMRAELVMRKAMDERPITVVRPTMMVGDSTSGESERFDGTYLLVLLALGLPGDLAMPLPAVARNSVNVVPLDFVVKAGDAIARDPWSPGRTFHLASPESPTVQQVIELIAQAVGRPGKSHAVIPTQVARAFLMTPGLDRVLREPRIFLEQLATTAQFDTRNARRVLGDAGIECPPLASYVDTWVNALQDQLGLRRDEAEQLPA
jgi:thioester reductase-like protein